jgi:8-oxo-dGTP diphosphatase
MKWEFPGGKVEDGEDHQSALRRELQEELCIEVGDLNALAPVTHAYDFGTIRLWPFLCRCEQPPRLKLVEHTDFVWSSLAEFRSLDWAPADVPVLAELADILQS